MSLWSSLARIIGASPAIPPRKRTRDQPIRRLEPPDHVRVAIPRLEPAVRAGDAVVAHQLLAKSADGARWTRRIHAPLTGRVDEVTEGSIRISGTPPPAPAARHTEPGELEPAAITEHARRAGLVGLGGAMFPTYVKLDQRHPIDCVLINGCESEPYFTCDHRVLTEHRAEVLCGLELAKRAVGAARGLIIEHEDYYPGGYENFVIRDALGRTVPNRGLPRDVQVLVLNVQTARALHDAVCLDQPVIERVLTVDGDAVGRPGNYLVPIGTPIAHILEVCDTDLSAVELVTAGGPMMGREVDHQTGVTAGMGGVLALTRAEVVARTPQPCLRCGRCYEACPLDLPVAMLVAEPNPDVLRCMSCGACQYVCPASIDLVDKMRQAKERETEWD